MIRFGIDIKQIRFRECHIVGTVAVRAAEAETDYRAVMATPKIRVVNLTFEKGAKI